MAFESAKKVEFAAGKDRFLAHSRSSNEAVS